MSLALDLLLLATQLYVDEDNGVPGIQCGQCGRSVPIAVQGTSLAELVQGALHDCPVPFLVDTVETRPASSSGGP